MPHAILCLLVLATAYLANIFYVSVLYHRGFTHGAVVLGPRTRRFAVWSGSWVTGIDAKAWACMHRLHHLHSDTPQDPHSPYPGGVPGVMLAQLRSYQRVLAGLIVGREPYRSVVADLEFPVHWLNRKRLWFLPYVLHALVGAGLGVAAHSIWLGLAYWLGMMSHPIQGWMVNALGHRFGYRNFETPDRSRNNLLVAWLVAGEGFQNNHHQSPRSPRFSYRWSEVDWGYGMARVAALLGMLRLGESRVGADPPAGA
jgi:stearoyl-CoA desaturase (delta-9 desaturase)